MPPGNPNWIKGVSGNPGGRPKDPFKEAIRKQFGNGEQLIAWMVGLAQCADKESDRIKAIEWLTDRGYGKVAQPVEHSGEVDLGLGGLLEQVKDRDQKPRLLA
jgi:hypothetical protein